MRSPSSAVSISSWGRQTGSMVRSGTSVVGVCVRGLGKAFRGAGALRGVDLDLAPGEPLFLFGPNGAGKTTLLKILATLVRPTRGSGVVSGADLVRARDQIRHRIEILSHGSALYEELSPRENLSFAAAIRGDRPAEGAGAAALERVGLGGVAGERGRPLAGGGRRRVA